MINHLIEYAKKNDIFAEPGFAVKSGIKWKICFSADSLYPSVFSASADKKGMEIISPSFPSNILQGGGMSHFLVESLNVVCNFNKENEDEKRITKSKEKNRYFISLIKECADETGVSGMKALSELLQDEHVINKIHEKLIENKAKPEDKAVIVFDDKILCRDETIRDWWRKKFRSVVGSAEKGYLPDLSTGEYVDPMKSHGKIKQLPGGLSTGDALICMDKDSFQSYGFKSSEGAPLSEENVKLYTTALNKLIRENSKSIGGALCVFWYKDPPPVDLVETIEPNIYKGEHVGKMMIGFDTIEKTKPVLDETETIQEKQASALLQLEEVIDSIESGKNPRQLKNEYYIITMSGASGRISIRDFSVGSYLEIAKNTRDWFRDLRISAIGKGGAVSPSKPPKFYWLLKSLFGDEVKTKDIPGQTFSKLWGCAVSGRMIPIEFVGKIVGEIKTRMCRGDYIKNEQASLLKAYHNRKKRNNLREKGVCVVKEELDMSNPSPAYQCGRLLAIMANVQESALGDVGAGVIQRFYASASSTPSLVLGRLIRSSQYHLDKIGGGLKVIMEREISEVISKLGNSVPQTFTLEEQSLFALGYYQQKAHHFKKMAERKANKEASR